MLTEAGLDVAALEAEGRMVVVEMDFDAPAEGSAEPWREALDDALARKLHRPLVRPLPGRARGGDWNGRGAAATPTACCATAPS